MDGVEDYYMVEENSRGAERGAFCFTWSHLVLRISLAVVLLFGACWCVCVCVCLFFVFCFFSLPGKLLLLIRFQSHSNFQLLTDHVSYSTGIAGKK